MLRIGEVSKKFNISNRTLRYWEEKGILNSFRAENGYRYYDKENAARIKQIAVLRKLEMPIADIEKLFMANTSEAAVQLLSAHLANLQKQAIFNKTLSLLVEKLIIKLQAAPNMAQVFTCLNLQQDAFLKHQETLQIILSEREMTMSAANLSNVRIVKLPPMAVASFSAKSITPEDDCAKVVVPFVLKNNLNKRGDFRFFGFNNPSPTEGNPVYGYEMWITIPEDFSVPAPFQKKRFEGGLYASISTQMNEIGERWMLLYNWCTNNDKYEADPSAQWMEECCMDYESFHSNQVDASEKQLDLLSPIRPK